MFNYFSKFLFVFFFTFIFVLTGFSESIEGSASWYGAEFHGRPTANGEMYDRFAFTAAHKTLPFNTFLLVTNLTNGKKVIVRVNDRGPFVKNRILDVSEAAANELGMIKSGTALVRIDIIEAQNTSTNSNTTQVSSNDVLKTNDSKVANTANSQNDGVVLNQANSTSKIIIQVAAFKDYNNAERCAEQLKGQGFIVQFEDYQELRRVLVLVEEKRFEAQKDTLFLLGYKSLIVRRETSLN